MRDLRLWVLEYGSNYSSRTDKLMGELEHINRELHYLQLRAFLGPLFFWLFVYYYVKFRGSGYWRGHMNLYNRPVITQNTGGTSMMTDGSVPKFTGADLADTTGGL